MKKLSVLLALAMVLGLGVSNVCAEMYFSGNVGIGWVDDISLTDGVETIDLSFDPGYGVSAAFGHAYSNGFRTEIEFNYFSSDLDEVTVVGEGSASLNGDGTVVAVMVNGLYDFMPGQTFNPFVGAGVGYANAEIDLLGISEDDDVFAYQLIAGVAFKLTERLTSDVQYRYFGTEDLEFEDVTDADSVNTHNLMVGLRYSF